MLHCIVHLSTTDSAAIDENDARSCSSSAGDLSVEPLKLDAAKTEERQRKHSGAKGRRRSKEGKTKRTRSSTEAAPAMTLDEEELERDRAWEQEQQQASAKRIRFDSTKDFDAFVKRRRLGDESIELIDGVLVPKRTLVIDGTTYTGVEPMPTSRHGRAQGEIQGQLRNYAMQQHNGDDLGEAGTDVTFNNIGGGGHNPSPDVAFVARHRNDGVAANFQVPNVAVEIGSSQPFTNNDPNATTSVCGKIRNVLFAANGNGRPRVRVGIAVSARTYETSNRNRMRIQVLYNRNAGQHQMSGVTEQAVATADPDELVFQAGIGAANPCANHTITITAQDIGLPAGAPDLVLDLRLLWRRCFSAP